MGSSSELKRAVIVLNPAESKRLIARAVAQLPEVRWALRHGRLIVGNGTTNAFVVEELLGQPVCKWRYAAGVIAGGRLDVTEGDTRLAPVALKQGERFEQGWVELLREFGRGDVFVKGGNALDGEGNVGVLLASDIGGTVGQMVGILAARGAHLIAPVGLEKLVPDVAEAARHCGISITDLTDGIPVGMAVLANARVVTELEALEVLCEVQAWHIASGGVAGSEGGVTIAVEGEAAGVEKAFKLSASLGGEAAVGRE
jgi:hypothetical protein